MPTFTKRKLSGSTNGRPIKVLGATTSGGTLVHAVNSATGADNGDEVWVYAHNYAAAARVLTVRLGGTATSDGVSFQVPSKDGFFLVCPGMFLDGGVEVRAFAKTSTGGAASNAIAVGGWINRIAT